MTPRGRTFGVEAGGVAVGARVIGSLEEAAELLPVDGTVGRRRHRGWRAAEHERRRAFVTAVGWS